MRYPGGVLKPKNHIMIYGGVWPKDFRTSILKFRLFQQSQSSGASLASPKHGSPVDLFPSPGSPGVPELQCPVSPGAAGSGSAHDSRSPGVSEQAPMGDRSPEVAWRSEELGPGHHRVPRGRSPIEISGGNPKTEAFWSQKIHMASSQFANCFNFIQQKVATLCLRDLESLRFPGLWSPDKRQDQSSVWLPCAGFVGILGSSLRRNVGTSASARTCIRTRGFQQHFGTTFWFSHAFQVCCDHVVPGLVLAVCVLSC